MSHGTQQSLPIHAHFLVLFQKDPGKHHGHPKYQKSQFKRRSPGARGGRRLGDHRKFAHVLGVMMPFEAKCRRIPRSLFSLTLIRGVVARQGKRRLRP